jgi:membrane-bound lytic murein transglycosylase D
MSHPNRTYPAFILFFSLVLVFGCAHPTIPAQETGTNVSSDTQTALGNAPAEEGPASTGTVAHTPETADAAPAEPLPPAQNGSIGSGSKKDNNDDEQALLDSALELTETAQEYWTDGETDQAIEALDQAYGCLLKVPGNKPDLIQQKEELRFVISKRLLEMYAARQTSVSGTSAAIPMVLNDHVEREIRSFQTMERDFFLESYKRSGRYRKDMVAALKAAGLPEELSWLPLIESGFKIRALSRSRAFGLWQFIPSTGYKFGLKRNAWIDERLDPAKSTDAAIAYFNELHKMFGDWATVLAAYNCGEGSVARVIRNQKVDYLDNFWDFYERLPRETARYFPRFLAVLTIVKDPAKYGFTLPDMDSPLSYETVTIERPVHLRSIAEKVGIDEDDLIALNPELRNGATPNTSYALRVPPGAGEAVVAHLDKLPKWSPPKVEFVMHRVRRGETLSIIALRYRTSIQKIVEANNMRSGKLLRVGQRLKIPVRNST